MEYKGATIVAILLFVLLFVGALFMLRKDTATETDAKNRDSFPKVGKAVPDPQPDKIDPDADTEYTELPSGLKYKILRKGTGPKPTPDDAVAVAYKGWTEGGAVFDSSYGKERPYLEVNPPWGVIDGWKEALPLLNEGGMMEVEIPAELGYGPNAVGSIASNSTLWFKIEILKVFKKK